MIKQVLAFGVLGGLLLLGNKVWGAKRISDKAAVKTSIPRVHRVDLKGMLLHTDVVIDNPTNTSITVTKPVITLMSGGKFLGSSVPVNQQLTVAPMAQSSLGTVEILIPWSALAGIAQNLITMIPALVSEFQRTKKLNLASLSIPMEYRYSTYVNDLFYESDPVTLV